MFIFYAYTYIYICSIVHPTRAFLILVCSRFSVYNRFGMRLGSLIETHRLMNKRCNARAFVYPVRVHPTHVYTYYSAVPSSVHLFYSLSLLCCIVIQLAHREDRTRNNAGPWWFSFYLIGLHHHGFDRLHVYIIIIPFFIPSFSFYSKSTGQVRKFLHGRLASRHVLLFVSDDGVSGMFGMSAFNLRSDRRSFSQTRSLLYSSIYVAISICQLFVLSFEEVTN